MNHKILVINPGSTSTKIAVYTDTKEVFLTTLRHSAEELAPFSKLSDQFAFRKQLIVGELIKANISIDDFTAVMGRGGILRPMESGTYEVNELMKKELIEAPRGEHASNLGGLIAADIANTCPQAKAYISDPVVVDEMDEKAKLTGIPQIQRKSIFHALNQKAISKFYAKSINKNYEHLNLIVTHMGGGISVGAHKQGKVVDVNNAVDGTGSFSPERAGTVPAGDLARLCFSGEYTLPEILKMLNGQGGLMGHLGLNAANIVADKASTGDKQAELVLTSMAYNIAKEIAAMTVPLEGKVDAIILTGGIAYNNYVVDRIKPYIQHLAKVVIYPGEDEMKALAFNCLEVLEGKVAPKVY